MLYRIVNITQTLKSGASFEKLVQKLTAWLQHALCIGLIAQDFPALLAPYTHILFYFLLVVALLNMLCNNSFHSLVFSPCF